MRVLFDYRPALRARTGVGEYLHGMVCALAGTAAPDDDVVAFSSSWKDRLAEPCEGVEIVDAQVPVRALNLLWHRLGWPAVERFSGAVDIVHSPTPLLIPSRRAHQIVTIHDLFFLDHPDATTGEVRRDYAALIGRHARRAGLVVTVSHHIGGLVVERLNVDPARVFTCRAGAPPWTPREAVPSEGPVVFLGTLEPRKNVVTLLEAWERLVARGGDVPELVLAGGQGAHGSVLLDRIARAPLAGRVRHVGYLPNDAREAFYKQARLLVLPSLDEGFGLPVLEACAAGVPVLASRCGALPEVGGDAAEYLDPLDPDAWADTVTSLLASPARLEQMRVRGVSRAATFSWTDSARALWLAYHSLASMRAA